MMNRLILFLALTACAYSQPTMPFAVWKSAAVSPSLPPVAGYSNWYDASDASSITKDGSNYVSQWNDKSGRGKHISQGTAAQQPVYYADSLNGRPAVKFISTRRDRMDVADTLSDSSMTVFAVAVMDQRSESYARIVSMAASATSDDYLAASGAAAMLRRATLSKIGGYSGTDLDSQFVTPLVPFVATSVWAKATHLVRVDSLGGTPVARTVGAFPVRFLRIGSVTAVAPTAAGAWHGLISEVIIYRRELSITEIRQVEAYLKTKWGTP